MPRTTNGKDRESKRRRKGRRRKGGDKREEVQTQSAPKSFDVSIIANKATRSGKTVGELIDELGLIANQLGNIVSKTEATSSQVVHKSGQQARELLQNVNAQ